MAAIPSKSASTLAISLDMLQEIDGETVRFEMASAAAPTVVRDPADASTLYVLMPMRV